MLLFILSFFAHSSITSAEDQFHESLLLRPLEDGSLFAEFKFNVLTSYADVNDNIFYDLFPKSIGQFFIRLPIWQFDLTLTRGRWDYDNFGSFHPNIAPYGAELQTVFYKKQRDTNKHQEGKIKTEFNKEWLIFQQLLSGLYCASINEMDVQIVNNSNHQFTPTELDWLDSMTSHDWSHYYGILPKENICTENLTPWSKLLPCRRNAGLSVLLNPSRVFSAKYQSMQVHVAPLGKDKFMRMTQTFQLVFGMNQNQQIIEKIKKGKKWGIKELFGINDKNLSYLEGCPVADSSLIIFDIPEWVHHNMGSWNFIKSKQKKAIKPMPHIVYVDQQKQSQFAVYSLQDVQMKTIKFSWPKKMFGYNRVQPKDVRANSGFSKLNYLKTERYLNDYDQVYGQLVICVRNQHPTETIQFSYFDAFPLSAYFVRYLVCISCLLFIHTHTRRHFLKLYFHSMNMQIDERRIDPFTDLQYFNMSFSKHKSTSVRIRNENPVTMEFVVSLQPNSELKVRMDIEKMFEHFESYPPDYNRGFDIGNGIITILDDKFNLMDYHTLFMFGDEGNQEKYAKNEESEYEIIKLKESDTVPQTIYTSQMLVLLPYPDMSMVFNVIAFSSTLFAYFFGTGFNNMYRDIKDLDKRNFDALTSKLKSLLTTIVNILRRIKGDKDKIE